MSSSSAAGASAFIVKSTSGVWITIYDATGVQLLQGEAAIDVHLSHGLYRVQFKRGDRTVTCLVSHTGTTVVEHAGPAIDSPSPIVGASASHDHYASAAVRSSMEDTGPPLGAPPHLGRLFVFLRRADRARGPARLPSEPLTIHDVNGRALATFGGVTSRADSALGYITLSCAAAAGSYRLRAARSRRDLAIPIPADRAAHVFLSDADGVRLDDARISLVSAGTPFAPASPIAAAMESVLSALRAPGPALPAAARALWPGAVEDDLCFGIASAHLLWMHNDIAMFDAVMSRLQRHVGSLPDLVILEHARRAMTGAASAPWTLSSPPLMSASLVLAMTLSERSALQVVRNSALEHAARGAYRDSPWCTWSARAWDERWVEATIESLRVNRPHDSVGSIARILALPEHTVEQTISILDATIPQSDVQVPGYTIGDRIGRGSRGSVFRAIRRTDDKAVALKILPMAGDPEPLRALRAFDVGGSFSHPRILTINAHGIASGGQALWLDTELCRGSVLDLLAESDEPLALHPACDHVLQALEALEYMHDRAYVHGDIKPSSLLLRDDGSVVLADTGLVVGVNRRGPARAGQPERTARFACREQLLDLEPAAPSWDVWSMAATLYFMLTLEYPRDEYAGQNELRAALDNSAVPIAARRPEVPDSLARCIDRALSEAPSARPRDARGLKRELAAALRPTHVSSRSTERHALVIGAQLGALRATENDTRSMAAMLESRGFTIDLRTGADATREGILAGYDQLIARSGPDAAAVIYYSGTGFQVAIGEHLWAGIAPTDIHHSVSDDWRGITAWELSIKQAQLTRKSRNVAVIMDCCYAGVMTRDAAIRGAIPRVAPPDRNRTGDQIPLRERFEAHLKMLASLYGFAMEDVSALGNPDIVRFAACGPTESAFEYRNASGEYRGVFTSALLDVLAEVGDAEVSWSAIEQAVRSRVLSQFPTQRPELVGPGRRLLFSLLEKEDSSVLALAVSGRELVLGGGWLTTDRLTRPVPGDVYGVMPGGAVVYRAAEALGEIEVVEVGATRSKAQWTVPRGPMAGDLVAIPLTKAALRWPVAIVASDAHRSTVEAAVAAMPTLRIAEPDDSSVIATLRVTEASLTIEDEYGPLYFPAPFPAALDHMLQNVANLGAARKIREFEGEHGGFGDELEVEMGSVGGGRPRMLPDHGAILGLHDRIFVKVRNKGTRRLFVHVFNIGLRGTVRMLTRGVAPAGVALAPGGPAFVLGERPDGTLNGLALSWPEELPRENSPRLDEIVIIVTTERTSLVSFETSEHVSRAGSSETRLQALLAQVQDGVTRDVTPGATDGHFYMKRLWYLLNPRPAVLSDLTFEIDENPSGQGAALEPSAWIPSGLDADPADHAGGKAVDIAVRLEDLVVEQVPFARNLRIDALVSTCSASRGRGYAAWTAKCADVDRKWRLRAGGELLYVGPVHNFFDITLFVARDDDAGPDLMTLLTERGGKEVADAVSALVITPGAPWADAVAASAVLARTAYGLVSAVTGKAIGLFRTTHLARDGFGVGRHPNGGHYRAGGFAFSLMIDQVADAR